MNPTDTNKIDDSIVSQDNSVPVIEDVNKAIEEVIIHSYKKYIILYIFLVLGSIALVYFLNADIRFIFFSIMIGVFGYLHIKTKIKSEFTQQFGASIGFKYSTTDLIGSVGGKLFSTGHSQSIFDVLTGVHDGLPMRIFSFRFTVGSGRDSHTYTYTVFEVILNNKVPDILLYSNAHSNNVVSDYFSGDETLQLEGDFNKYFKLRVPKGYEQEAYQIFTPDAMADLIDKARDYSFEFVDNKLYVYATWIINKRSKFDEMFTLVTFIDGLFRKNASSIDMN